MRNAFGRNVFATTRLPVRSATAATGDDDGSSLIDVDVTESLAFGADLRSTYVYNRLRAPLTNLSTFILMQGDLYAAAATAGDRLTFYLDLGIYGSGEAMVIARGPGGLYAKVGRFMPSYGLRLENHRVFVREGIGFGPREKEVGLEIGLQAGGFHLQASVLNGATDGDTPLFDDNWQKAITGRAEYIRAGRFLNVMAGASGFYNIKGASRRAGDEREGDIRAGGFVGASLGRLTYLAEADVTLQRKFTEFKWLRTYSSYQELDVLVARGVELNFNWEYNDPDLRYSQNALHRVMGGFEVFPVPHLELKAFYRRVIGRSTEPLSGSHEVFAMVHFYL